MNGLVAELVALYINTSGEALPMKNVSDYSDDESLILDLRKELDDKLRTRNTPLEMTAYTATVLRAFQIIRSNQ